MRCAIWYYLYNLENVKNTHGGVLILLKASACNFTKINTPPWVFFTFLDIFCKTFWIEFKTSSKQVLFWTIVNGSLKTSSKQVFFWTIMNGSLKTSSKQVLFWTIMNGSLKTSSKQVLFWILMNGSLKTSSKQVLFRIIMNGSLCSCSYIQNLNDNPNWWNYWPNCLTKKVEETIAVKFYLRILWENILQLYK